MPMPAYGHPGGVPGSNLGMPSDGYGGGAGLYGYAQGPGKAAEQQGYYGGAGGSNQGSQNAYGQHQQQQQQQQQQQLHDQYGGGYGPGGGIPNKQTAGYENQGLQPGMQHGMQPGMQPGGMQQPQMQPQMQPGMQTGMQHPGDMRLQQEQVASQIQSGGTDKAPAVAGIRATWNLWPPTKADAQQTEVPLAILYTPLEDQNVPVLNQEPIRSRSSGCILNPYCQVDYRGKVWNDPLTFQRNAFPPHYASQLTEQNVPPELIYNTVEYILPSSIASSAPCFIFVIDTCLFEEELEVLRDSLQLALSSLPPEAVVGLITYGTIVNLYELGFAECPKNYVFRGAKEVTVQDLKTQLGLGGNLLSSGAQRPIIGASASGAGMGMMGGQPSQTGPQMGGNAGGPVGSKFLLSMGDAEFVLNTILDDLQVDAWPVPTDHRAQRVTGAALSCAISLMELCANRQGGRVMLFTGGVCTSGPGQVAGLLLSEGIRHHMDLHKQTPAAKYSKQATKFYQDLAARAVAAGFAVDIFACSLDQCGLYEMKALTEKTGGVMVMSDTFSLNTFKDSFAKMFELDSNGLLPHAYNAVFEVLCSKEVRLCGAIGCCSSTNKKGSQVGDLTIGEAETCEWSISSVDSRSTLAIYLDVVNTSVANLPPSRHAVVQFIMTYKHADGTRRRRVQTLAFPFAQMGVQQIALGFDQEAATVAMARLAVKRADTDEPMDIMRWLDRKLIRLVSSFGDYQKDRPETFQLASEFSMYPQFMFHLRRSQFLQTFNASPDETAYYRSSLIREGLRNTLVMILPSLLEYSFQSGGAPLPVMLDSAALKNDVILLLDSFFHVVVWHGAQIQRWLQQGWHEKPEYAHLQTLQQQPQEDAKKIIRDRFPAPKFVVCHAGGSQARFLLARVNPSQSSPQEGYDPEGAGSAVITDDVSMKVFMDHLIKLAVQS